MTNTTIEHEIFWDAGNGTPSWPCGWCAGTVERDDSGVWQAQPGLGREPDGLSTRLDRWPARPGEEQHPWEAPRVCGKCDNRAARLKALGNAVVPQVGFVVGQVVRRIMEAT